MSIEKSFQIIEDNFDEADFAGPIGRENINVAEKILRIEFSSSYRTFLQNYGAGDIFGIEFYGIIKDPKTDRNGAPNVVWVTQNFRNKFGLPHKYIVLSDTGYGPYIVLDVSVKNAQNESPVFIWDSGVQSKKIADSFGEFMFGELNDMLEE